MEKYKDNIKLYSKILKEESVILKLLDIGNYPSINIIKQMISNCKWESEGKFINVYNFENEEIINNKELFSSSILINTSFIINEIFIYDYFTEILFDKEIGNLDYGNDIYVEIHKEKIKLGTIVDISNNRIIIQNEIHSSEINLIKNKNLLIDINIYSIQNINKGVYIYLPVIQIDKNNWAYDCIIDKKTYEINNKLCFNLLDDLNIANSCGLISIMLIGIIIGRISLKKNINNIDIEDNHDNKYLFDILNKIKNIKKEEIRHNKNRLKSAEKTNKENDDTDNDDTDNEEPENDDIGNEETENKDYLKEFNNEINSNIFETNSNIIKELKKDEKDMDNIYLYLNSLENKLDNNIEYHIKNFDNIFQKIKLNESIETECKHLLSNNQVFDKEYIVEEEKKIKKSKYYIDLLKNYE